MTKNEPKGQYLLKTANIPTKAKTVTMDKSSVMFSPLN